MRTRPVGRRGVLLEPGPAPYEVAAAVRGLAAQVGVPLEDVVPGARTVLVLAREEAGLARLVAALPGLVVGPDAPREALPEVEIAVRYDGPDLQDVADAVGLEVEDVVRRHLAGRYRAAHGLRARLRLPGGPGPGAAPAPPRHSAPGGAGRVARARRHLDGRLPAAQPRRLAPGRHGPGGDVRPEPRARCPGQPGAGRALRRGPALSGAELEVLDGGPLTTVQDEGRPGLGALGVPPSGALDRPAAALANRLVGNPPGAALLEATLSGPRLRVRSGARTVVVAVTGAPAPVLVDGRPYDALAPLALQDGAVLEIGAATAGVRTYLAVRGGLVPPPVLGSRSYELLSGLGPPPLAAGDRLPVGPPSGAVPAVDAVPLPGVDPVPVLAALAGPRDDWFAAEALALLTATAWELTPDSNRIGLRLAGPPLPRRRDGQLPSEGVVAGSVQVPQDGQPVLFLADHPTTGGYPVLAVVDDAGLAAAAQARPGTSLRFALARGR